MPRESTSKRRVSRDSSQPKKRLRATTGTDSDFTRGRANRPSSSPADSVSSGEVRFEASRSPPRVDSSSRHQLCADEEIEDAELQVNGETAVDPDDADDVPVRLLTGFSIYSLDTFDYVETSLLLTLDEDDTTSTYGASGIVERYVDEDDENDDDLSDGDSSLDVQRVQLSKILELNVHWSSTSRSGLSLDPRIYIRTRFAWYILDIPSRLYRPFFTDFWTRHRILHDMVSECLEHPTLTYKQFLDAFRVEFDALRIIRTVLTAEDVESDHVQSYILSTLNALCGADADLHRALSRVPLICMLRGEEDPAPRQRKMPAHRLKILKDREQDVLQHRNKTVVTPAVATIAQKLFHQGLCLAGETLRDGQADVPVLQSGDEVQVHEADPLRIDWVEDSRSAPHHYREVHIDGVKYSVGDAVVVEKGNDDDRKRERNAASEPAQSSNWLANSKWFAIISYMFEKEESVKTRFGMKKIIKKFFHAQWLQHGSQTLLQETAHPNVLYYLNECDDLPLECIFEHCKLRIVLPHEDDPSEDESSQIFHTGLTWDPHRSTFFQLDNGDISTALLHCKPWKRCLPCGLLVMSQRQSAWKTLTGGGFSRHGVDYHHHDFVYLRPPGLQNELYFIVQIMEFKVDHNGEVHRAEVLQYGRHDQIIHSLSAGGGPMATDNRRLFKTDSTITVDISLIDGKTYVAWFASSRDIEAWTEHDNHFYVDCHSKTADPRSLDMLHKLKSDTVQPCLHCYTEHVLALKEQEVLLQKWGALQGLELFAGAGGLSTGLEMSGFVKTKWAVEFSPSAALTYKANHPDTIVYNQCSNLLLQHALDVYEGKSPQPLRNLQEGSHHKVLPPMPKQGEVDFIYGGPPCQSFSAMNHHKKADDIRNTLVCNMLSYVEFYRPSYFLLENVVGLLQFPLNGTQAGQAISGGVKMGVVKLIIRTLLCLGYQVHFKVLQAGQYGAPQYRRRVIFWGARRDINLPEFPAPLHWFPKTLHSFNLPTGNILYPPTCSVVDRDSDRADYHQCAPLPLVTVEDALGDLPPFDWINPHNEIPMTADDLAEAGDRCADGIRRFVATLPQTGFKFPGFPSPIAYAYPPLTRYQKWMRSNMKKVTYQYTRRFAANVVERVTTLPIKQNADHVDLPAKLRIGRLFVNGQARANYRGLYGRINGKGSFQTAMTTIAPNAKGGRVIHPTQKRIVSVRECARAQGFPDSYQFLSANNTASKQIADQHRQIGNAVPVPLALALGKELGKALVKSWSAKEASHHLERAQSPDIPFGDRDISPEL